MSSIDPLKFFLWDKPRLLIDIRPNEAFTKGTLEQAISLPVNDHDPIEDFQCLIKEIQTNLPIHLIDHDGKTAQTLSENIPLQYLEGGYKFFKIWREHTFHSSPPLCILGGYTGSGKTDFLHYLKISGHQIIDLEQLACHKGSVFGYSEGDHQPLHEDFQNRLLEVWLTLSPELPVWIEEKGPFLGIAGLPKSLYNRMAASPLIHLDVPFEQRLKHILNSYGSLEPARFRSALQNLEPRMGTSANQKALHFYDSGQKEKCFELLLKYYDSAYEKRRWLQWRGKIVPISHNSAKPEGTLEKLKTL